MRLRGLIIGSFLCWMATDISAAPLPHHPEARIDRAAIRLSDIFSGLPASADTEIAMAPAPGRSVTYDYTILSRLARRYGLDWQASSFGDKCVITRLGQRIGGDRLREAVIGQLRDSGVSGDMEVLLDQRNLEINLPRDIKPDFALHDFSYDRASQRFRAELLAAADTPHFQQISLTGRAVPVVDVPVLSKPLSQGSVIGRADIEWMKIPVERAGDALRGANAVMGMELRRSLPEQTVLRAADVMPPRVVQHGQIVTMRVTLPQMELTAQGRVLQDGAVGDVVRVSNTQSHRVVEAKVVAAGVVDVMTSARMAGLQN